jgi:hypothetical protein
MSLLSTTSINRRTFAIIGAAGRFELSPEVFWLLVSDRLHRIA